jgi:hypothetical protein
MVDMFMEGVEDMDNEINERTTPSKPIAQKPKPQEVQQPESE